MAAREGIELRGVRAIVPIDPGRSGRGVVVRTELDVLAAQFAHGFVPLSLIFGSAAETHEEKEERSKRKRM